MKRKLAKLCRGISHDEEGETRHNYAFKVRGTYRDVVANYYSSVSRKPDFCLWENKGTNQLCNNSAFVFAAAVVQFLLFLNSKFPSF